MPDDHNQPPETAPETVPLEIRAALYDDEPQICDDDDWAAD